MKALGVLNLQGGVVEHLDHLERLGISARPVKEEADLQDLAGLIIPGGESTCLSRLLRIFALDEVIKREFDRGMKIWGTCAGAILLSKDARRAQPLLGLMDITVARNAFGRQVDSFEADLDIPKLKQATGTKDPYHAVFIRAPIIESVYGEVKVLASLPDKRIVAAQQGHLLATSFHPELTNDTRFHEYFLSLAD